MKLTVLVDNHTYIDRYYLGEPAVCYLIEDGDRVILLDAGYSDVFIENAARMGIDLGHVTDIVLSHGHNDHTGGLPAFFARFTQPVRLYAHPGALLPIASRDRPALPDDRSMWRGQSAIPCRSARPHRLHGDR